MNKESEQVFGDQNKAEANAELFRQLSQRGSIMPSISRGYSMENRSFHSSDIHDTILTDQKAAVKVTKRLQNIPLCRLAAFNKPEILILLVGVIAATFNGVILPLFGLLVSRMITVFYEPPHEQKKHSLFWVIMFMVLGVGSLVVILAQDYFFAVAGCKLIQRIRLMCFKKVVHMEMGWFDEPGHSSGAIGARLSADAMTIRALVGDALGLLVQNIASAVAGLVIAFLASWQLSLIILILLPLIGINGYIEIKFMKGFSANTKVRSKTNE